jgi:oxygen-dependent protoporphyrinogen oxidase
MLATKKILILGGGISGLSLAYQLGKAAQVTLIEKEKSLGGWAQTQRQLPYFFEKGPRTFPVARSHALLQLCKEVGLEDQILLSSPQAKKRYLWHKHKLRSIPGNPFASPMRSLVAALVFKEWRIPPNFADETIWEFAARRFTPAVADLFFDPITQGIFAGDARELSIQSCFPFLKRLERDYGSLLKGAVWHRYQKNPSPLPTLPQSSLFSFKGGVSTLIEYLRKKTKGNIILGEEVIRLTQQSGGWLVATPKNNYRADIIISALPAMQLAKLVAPLSAEIASLLASIPYQPLTIAHVGYASKVLTNPGFGYLIPSCEQEKIGGMVFDSSLFPEHNHQPRETRLTALMRGLVESPEEIVSYALHKHLHICSQPHFLHISHASASIPHYLVGHQQKVERLQALMVQYFPSAFLVGSYLNGVSVNDCIAQAMRVCEQVLF